MDGNECVQCAFNAAAKCFVSSDHFEINTHTHPIAQCTRHLAMCCVLCIHRCTCVLQLCMRICNFYFWVVRCVTFHTIFSISNLAYIYKIENEKKSTDSAAFFTPTKRNKIYIVVCVSIVYFSSLFCVAFVLLPHRNDIG